MRSGQTNNRICDNAQEIVEAQSDSSTSCQFCEQYRMLQVPGREQTVKNLSSHSSTTHEEVATKFKSKNNIYSCSSSSSHQAQPLAAKRNRSERDTRSEPNTLVSNVIETEDMEMNSTGSQHVIDKEEVNCSSLSNSCKSDTNHPLKPSNKEMSQPLLLDNSDMTAPLHRSLNYLATYESSSDELDDKIRISQKNVSMRSSAPIMSMNILPIKSIEIPLISDRDRRMLRRQSDGAEKPSSFSAGLRRKLSNASKAALYVEYDIPVQELATLNCVELLEIAAEEKQQPEYPRYNTRKRSRHYKNQTQQQQEQMTKLICGKGSPSIKEELEIKKFLGIRTRSQKRQQTHHTSNEEEPIHTMTKKSPSVKPSKQTKLTKTNEENVSTISSSSLKPKPSTPNKEKPSKATKKKSPLPTPLVSRKSRSESKESITAQAKSILDIRKRGQQISPEDLKVLDTLLGEGQVGTVHLAKYKGLLVACKTKRGKTRNDLFNFQIQRELKFAAKLSVCRYINRYIGWTYCKRSKVEEYIPDMLNPHFKKLYVIQRYISNGDARTYLDKRESTFQPAEVLQASICLFSALTDAHRLGIGIVDLKLENFLIDSSGAGWLTDFGSCIEFHKKKEVNLNEEQVAWTKNVAAPEMISTHQFSKASDVFMGSLIIAELLTAEFTDREFNQQIMSRNKINGCVTFSPDIIHDRYRPFFSLLKMGLANEPEKRPTASSVLDYLLMMKNKA